MWSVSLFVICSLSQEDHSKIKQLEKDVKEAQSKAKPAGPSAEEVCVEIILLVFKVTSLLQH